MVENTVTNELYSAALVARRLGRRFTRPLDAKGNSDSNRMSCHSHDGSALPFMVEEISRTRRYPLGDRLRFLA